MLGVVRSLMVQMVGICKTVWSAMVSTLKWLWKNIIAHGTDLMTLCVKHLSNLFALILLNIKQKVVPSIIVEDYNTVETMFANHRLGLIGRSLLTTVVLIPLVALKHLIAALWRVLVAMKVKLQKLI